MNTVTIANSKVAYKPLPTPCPHAARSDGDGVTNAPATAVEKR